jgi:hypothetical protein
MSLYLGFVGWIAYVAIEPFVRRYLPEAFAGWNRLLAGQFSNRIVGRDVLIGTTLTCVSAAITALVFLLIQDFTRPIEGPNSGLVETRTAVGLLLVWFSFSTALSMLMLVSLVIARQFLPRLGACIACTLLWTIPFFIPNAQPFLLNFILSFVLTSLTVFVLDRYGYLPIVVSWLVRIIILGPITFESHRWYSHISACILLAIAGAALYGMWTSTKPPVQAKSWS